MASSPVMGPPATPPDTRLSSASSNAPVVMGMILGPLAEAQMRTALSIGEGKWGVFVERPVSVVLLGVIVAVLVLPRAVGWL